MKKSALLVLIILSTSAFAKETSLTGNVARSLYYSLFSQKAAGGKVEMNSNSVRDGFQTSYWVQDESVQCTKSENSRKKTITFTCSVAE